MVPVGTYVAYNAYSSNTPYGHCISYKEPINPYLKYKPNIVNIIVSIVAFDIVVSEERFKPEEVICPVGVI
jgi:hypothetical protein